MGKKKTGIEEIAEERQEQIEVHKFSIENDAEYYQHYELIQAALFCIDQTTPQGYGLKLHVGWPSDWGKKFEKKILAKDAIGQLRVAGAFIAAEIDRLKLKQPKRIKSTSPPNKT